VNRTFAFFCVFIGFSCICDCSILKHDVATGKLKSGGWQLLSLWLFWCFFLFSSYKRYFYCHDTTGVTRWDYPEGLEAGVEDEQHRVVMNDTTEYQSIEALSAVPVPASEVLCPTEVFPGEPLPPGVDPPLPGTLSANILALAGCPPPPPPTGSDDVRSDDGDNDVHQLSNHPAGSRASDEDQLPSSTIPDQDPAARQNAVEISAPPVLNRPISPQPVNPAGSAETTVAECVDSETDVSHRAPSPPTTPSVTVEESTAHHHKERRRKKDKARGFTIHSFTHSRVFLLNSASVFVTQNLNLLSVEDISSYLIHLQLQLSRAREQTDDLPSSVIFVD